MFVNKVLLERGPLVALDLSHNSFPARSSSGVVVTESVYVLCGSKIVTAEACFPLYAAERRSLHQHISAQGSSAAHCMTGHSWLPDLDMLDTVAYSLSKGML